jgi:peptidoglycan/xylan/chitin deacetylase (PgdA/CDA1 family)
MLKLIGRSRKGKRGEMRMSILLSIFLGSYLYNLMPLKQMQVFRKEMGSFMDFTQGFITLFAVRFILNTQFALLIALLGMMIGRLYPVLKNGELSKDRNPESFPYLLLGALSVFAPKTFILNFIIILMLKYSLKDDNRALLGAFMVLPFLMWYIERYDIYVIFGLIASGSAVMQLLNSIEEQRCSEDILPMEGFYFDKESKRFSANRRAAFIFGFLLAFTLLFFNRYVYRGFGMQVDIIRHGTRDIKIVALTFDDGPDPKYTPQILDILREYKVPATFFVVGKNAEKHPEILQQIIKDGHSVGNHTYSHRSLVPLSNAGTYFEIMEADRIITEITGVKPVLFRPPRGLYSQYARELLKKERYTLVLWDVSSRDWAEIRPRDIERNVLTSVQPGSIVLFHDSGSLITNYGGDRHNTVLALPSIIENLKEQGYIFVTVDDMIVISGLTATEGVEYE